MKKRILALALTLPLLLSCSGCGAPAEAVDLMKGIWPDGGQRPPKQGPSPEQIAGLSDFSLALLRENAGEGENVLLSPLSIVSALGMTANGARGETLAQMEGVLGLPLTELNLAVYASLFPPSDQFHAANSIWFRDSGGLTVEEEFLQANANWYEAGAYRAPFDETTCRAINDWVGKNTDGMIGKILDEIPGDAVTYLINALAFDAKWETPYEEGQAQEALFTTENGEARKVTLMYSEEGRYLEDENAVGLLKAYAGGRYAFAALLPDEGVEMAGYLASLTGERLVEILENAGTATVDAAIPKFELEYGTELSEQLRALGMTDAFDANQADFSGLGYSEAGNLYLSRVLHRTCLSVDEQGTKAGAVTVVEVECGSAAPVEAKTVHLDRPFVCVIVDTNTNLPLFLGTVMDIGE